MPSRSKFDRDWDFRNDKKQIKFDKNGWIQPPEQPKKVEHYAADPNMAVFCPFCLYLDNLQKFFISNKDGISQGKAKCPDCQNGMMMKTLIKDMTTSQYADFVFGYVHSGFWKKCPFEKWSKRLRAAGMSREFWKRYKELKGEAAADNVFDDAERMARDYGITI